MARNLFYAALVRAVKTESEDETSAFLSRLAIDDIHGRLCENIPAEYSTRCVKCEHLLTLGRQQNNGMMALLLERGAFPPPELCAAEYCYGRGKSRTPLRLAIDYGTLDDVKELLSQGADVNAQAQVCFKNPAALLVKECTYCDTPLMAAARRRDIEKVRVLLKHGAIASAAIHATAPGESSKTALLVAAGTGNDQVITELVMYGADVNQLLGPRGTVFHHICSNRIMDLLVRLGADPNVKNVKGDSVFWHVLRRGSVASGRNLCYVLESMSHLLPNTRHLDQYIADGLVARCLNQRCFMLVLQHGAKIDYSCTFIHNYATSLIQEQHSEEFIEFLRAADTNFSSVRQRIPHFDGKKKKVLNTDVLEEKLSKPLTLQSLCVINVRRRLRDISEIQMWARIDTLSLPTAIRNRLKLLLW